MPATAPPAPSPAECAAEGGHAYPPDDPAAGCTYCGHPRPTDPGSPEPQPKAEAPAEVVEVVEPQVPSLPPETHSALERAAEAAMAMPGMPGADEFLLLAAQARMLSLSGAAPALVKGDPHVAFHVAMIGRDLGLSPSSALELIDVIKTKAGPRISLSPQLLNGQLRRLGLGTVHPSIRTEDRCVVLAVGPRGLDPRCVRRQALLQQEDPDSGAWHVPDDAPAGPCQCDIVGASEFTWEDARQAELVGPECMVGNHKGQTKSRNDGSTYQTCGCNQGYVTYPKRMLWWRASGFCADDYFPEASLGLYSPEALGAVIDVDGRPIDPASVELPEGYEPPPPPVRPPDPNTVPASPDSIAELQARIDKLPAGAKAAMRELWMAADDGGEPRLPPIGKLLHRHVPVARGVLSAIERRTKAGEFGDGDVGGAPDGTPQEPAGDDGGTDGAPEPAEASSDDVGAQGEADPGPPADAVEPAPADEPPPPAFDPANTDELVELLRQMRPPELRDACTHRGLATTGNPDALRHRLGQAMMAEGWTPPAPDTLL
jgi:hypothetical protein